MTLTARSCSAREAGVVCRYTSSGSVISAQAEGRILIGHKREGVSVYPVAPSQHADDEIKQTPWVQASEENGKPRNDHSHDRGYPEKKQNDVVRDGKEPFDQGQPAVHLESVWISEVKVNGLLLVG